MLDSKKSISVKRSMLYPPHGGHTTYLVTRSYDVELGTHITVPDSMTTEDVMRIYLNESVWPSVQPPQLTSGSGFVLLSMQPK